MYFYSIKFSRLKIMSACNSTTTYNTIGVRQRFRGEREKFGAFGFWFVLHVTTAIWRNYCYVVSSVDIIMLLYVVVV